MVEIYGKTERTFHVVQFQPNVLSDMINNWKGTGMVRKINDYVFIHQDVLFGAINMIKQPKKIITKL